MTAKQIAKQDFWRSHVEAAARFDGDATAYCREHGIEVANFYSWRKKLGKLCPRPQAAVSPFCPVEVVGGSGCNLPNPRWVAEVILRLARGMS